MPGAAAGPVDSSAVFAGGPFWALEEAFESVPGVVEVLVGYVPLPFSGGDSSGRGETSVSGKAAGSVPDFDEVVQGGTGHAFAVRVLFDPGQVTYGELLRTYLRNIDPTAPDRQFADSGSQYRTLILAGGAAQEKEARAALEKLALSGRFRRPLAVSAVQAGEFLAAEEGRQDYHRRYPGRYRAWLRYSGRTEGLRRIWGAEGPAGRRAGSAGRAGRLPRGGRAQDSGRISR